MARKKVSKLMQVSDPKKSYRNLPEYLQIESHSNCICSN